MDPLAPRPRRILGLRLLALGLVAVAATAGETARPREIVISILANQRQVPGLEAVARAYEQLHPDRRVRVEMKGGGSGVGYPTWLATQLATGAPRPDIVSSNYASNYDGYVDLDTYRWVRNPYSGRVWNDDFDFDYFQALNVAGKRITLGTQSVKVMWYYNRTKFEALGLKPPRTWPELIQLFDRIRQAGYQAHTLKFNYKHYQWLARIFWDQFIRPFAQTIRAQPGDWCFRPDADGAWQYHPEDPTNDAGITINYARLFRAVRDGEMRWDGPEFKAVLRALKDVADRGASDFMVSTATDNEDGYGRFLRQEALIHLETSGLVMSLERDQPQLAKSGRGFEWGVFDTPPLDDPHVKAPVRGIESMVGEYIGVIYKDQAQTDAVMDFLMFWLSPGGYQRFVDTVIAANCFQHDGELLVRDVKLPAEYQRLSRWMKRVGNAETQWNLPLQLAPEGSRLRNDAMLALTRYLQGEVDVDATAARIQQITIAAVPEVLQRTGLQPSDLDHPERDPR